MNLTDLEVAGAKKRLFAHEAKRWVGFKEQGGDNRGQIVEMFQRAVDGKANGEAWCMSFVQFCLNEVDSAFDELFQVSSDWTRLPHTESCVQFWNHTPEDLKTVIPVEGSIMVWEFYKNGKPTGLGHCGIVDSVGTLINTIEGNTGQGSGVVREGDGVYRRQRTLTGSTEMRVLGWVTPW